MSLQSRVKAAINLGAEGAQAPRCGLPAKKVVFELTNKNGKPEDAHIVFSYVFTKPAANSNNIIGYTYSVSCFRKDYPQKKKIMDEVIAKLEVH